MKLNHQGAELFHNNLAKMSERCPTYVYLLKMNQVYRGNKIAIDFTFRSRAAVIQYLETLWKHWKANLTEEEWDRVPPCPDYRDISIGLLQGGTFQKDRLVYEVATIGFQEQVDVSHSAYVTLTMMPVYS